MLGHNSRICTSSLLERTGSGERPVFKAGLRGTHGSRASLHVVRSSQEFDVVVIHPLTAVLERRVF